MKQIQAYTDNSAVDPTKGTIVNPYTYEEYLQMVIAGTWNGGFVVGNNYIDPYGFSVPSSMLGVNKCPYPQGIHTDSKFCWRFAVYENVGIRASFGLNYSIMFNNYTVEVSALLTRPWNDDFLYEGYVIVRRNGKDLNSRKLECLSSMVYPAESKPLGTGNMLLPYDGNVEVYIKVAYRIQNNFMGNSAGSWEGRIYPY